MSTALLWCLQRGTHEAIVCCQISNDKYARCEIWVFDSGLHFLCQQCFRLGTFGVWNATTTVDEFLSKKEMHFKQFAMKRVLMASLVCFCFGKNFTKTFFGDVFHARHFWFCCCCVSNFAQHSNMSGNSCFHHNISIEPGDMNFDLCLFFQKMKMLKWLHQKNLGLNKSW